MNGTLIYSFTLTQVCIVLGICYFLGHLIPLFKPTCGREFLVNIHRNHPVGYVLHALATGWIVWLLMTVELMDYTSWRLRLIIFVVVLAIAVAYFLPDYLAIRAGGLLAILFANVILDAAFLRDEPLKLVLVIAAYAYIVMGLFFVAAPYLYRRLIAYIYAKSSRLYAACVPGVIFGMILITIGILLRA